MADPLSILASVVGVSAAAAHTAKKIKEYIDTIQNVPEVVSSISSETAILRSTLLSLSSTIESDDNLQDPDIDPRFVQPFVSLKTLLEDCQRSFLSIRRAIEPYVEVDTRSKRRKWKLAATWKDHKKALEYVKRDLLSYKMSLDIALNFAMFLTTSAGNAAIQKQISQLQEQLAMTQTEAMLNIAPEVENIPADRNFALRHFLWETESTIGLEQDPNNSERQNLEDYDGDVVDGEDEDFERHQSLTKRTNASEEDPLSDTDSERSRHPDHPSPRPVKATDAQEEQYYDCLSYNTGDASTALIQPVVIAAASSDDCTKLGIPVNVHQFHPAQHQTASDSKHVIVIQGSSSSSNRNGKASRRYSFGLASSMYDSLCDEKNRLRFSFGLIPVAQDCTRPVFKSGDIVWMMEKGEIENPSVKTRRGKLAYAYGSETMESPPHLLLVISSLSHSSRSKLFDEALGQYFVIYKISMDLGRSIDRSLSATLQWCFSVEKEVYGRSIRLVLQPRNGHVWKEMRVEGPTTVQKLKNMSDEARQLQQEIKSRRSSQSSRRSTFAGRMTKVFSATREGV